GAKLVDGLSRILPSDSLTVIVNTGDDFDHLGLRICPDLDTVCYMLAGLANLTTGWGRKAETWNALQSLAELGGPAWFRLGDRDLGTHLERTRLLAKGYALSEVTQKFCEVWGIAPRILPMSDDQIPTMVKSDEGELAFQDYFVKRKCQPRVTGFYFAGIESAQPSPGVQQSLSEAEIVLICPSNPWVSIDPILAVPGIKEVILDRAKRKQVIAVSPIIAGAAVKGPAAKMYLEMGINPSAASVAQHYGSQDMGGLLNGYVFDHLDAGQDQEITGLGLATLVTNTLMKTLEDRMRLAEQVIDFGKKLLDGNM
ncbi:MAG: 2-phospho-L-lactate transferase, partial [Chloroflexi bacterium]|nr:2-phospho-L-lactate transferase [Chloroflexota bacterium]